MDFINMIGNGAGMAFAVFIGLYVDSVGPRIIGLIGATLATLGYGLMALSMSFPCSFAIGMWGQVPLNFGGSFMVYAPLAYIYLLPDHGFTVSAIFNIAFVVADLYGSSAALIYADGGSTDQGTARMFVGTYFLVMMIGTVIFSLIGCLLLVPDL